MSTITIKCSCGEIFYSNQANLGKSIRCPKCNSLVNIRGPEYSANPEEIKRSNKGESKFKAKNTLVPLLPVLYIIIPIVLIVLVFLYLSINKPITTDSYENPLATLLGRSTRIFPDDSNHDKWESSDIRLNNGSNPLRYIGFRGRSSLTVDNGTDFDAVVLLIRNENDRIKSSYIRSGSSYTINSLPPGKYIMKTAFGRDWNKQIKRFNRDKSYSKSEEFTITESKWNEKTDDGYIVHTRASNISITLHKVLNGNFRTSPIDEEEFFR